MSSHFLVPPINFGMVEEGLYRSGQPNALNFPFLERLKLKTIVYLVVESNDEFLNFVEDQGIKLVQLPADNATRTNMWMPISEEVVLRAIDVILQAENYPLLIMDTLGRHRTGTLVGCLRKLQRWNLTSILSEYRRYAGNKVRLMNEQFIELFDTDLVTMSANTPKWCRFVDSDGRDALKPT